MLVVRRDCGAGLRGVSVRAARRKWAGVSGWFGPMRVKDGSLRSRALWVLVCCLGWVVELAPSWVRGG